MSRKMRLRCSNGWDPIVCVALDTGDIDALCAKLKMKIATIVLLSKVC